MALTSAYTAEIRGRAGYDRLLVDATSKLLVDFKAGGLSAKAPASSGQVY